MDHHKYTTSRPDNCSRVCVHASSFNGANVGFIVELIVRTNWIKITAFGRRNLDNVMFNITI